MQLEKKKAWGETLRVSKTQIRIRPGLEYCNATLSKWRKNTALGKTGDAL